jgi:hypothetical protein
MDEAEFIPEHAVTAKALAHLFKRAFLKTFIDADGDLVVETDGPRVLVSVDTDLKLVKFMALYALNSPPPREAKRAFADRMNDTMIFCRFSIPQKNDDVLVADYFLPFEEGIPVHQIVSAFRLFVRVIPAAVNGCGGEEFLR